MSPVIRFAVACPSAFALASPTAHTTDVSGFCELMGTRRTFSLLELLDVVRYR